MQESFHGQPTFVRLVRNANLRDSATKGVTAGKKTFKVHIDGYNQVPYLTGKTPTSARHEYVYFSDDGDLLAYRDDRFKYHFEVQLSSGMNVWRMPLTPMRAPVMIDLLSDPYEYSWDPSAYWDKWAMEHACLMLPAVARVSAYLRTYKEFPPRQRPASFSIDQVIDKLTAATKGK